MPRKPYPTDVSDEEWSFAAPYLVLMTQHAPQREHSLREVFNALRWIVRAGSPWRLLPNDFPPWEAVYQQSRRWLDAGCFEAMAMDLRSMIRVASGRQGQPSAVVLDGRTLQSSCESGPRSGYDGYKRKRGSKVHMAVDTLGHLLAAAGARRRFMVGAATAVAAAGAVLAAPRAVRAQGALQDVKVSVGRIPWAAANSPITQYMIEKKLFEARAAEFGYRLTVDWRDYPTALPMVEAIVGNNLDIGMWGNTPIIRAIANKLPVSLLSVGEGHQRFVIATREGSPIRNIQDLKVPAGLDATSAFYPAFLPAQATGSVAVMNSHGYTEPHYKGPLGEGAGILLPSVKKSPFYPDGYYLHRSFWLAHNALLDKHPKLALAFLIAQQEALDALAALKNPGAVAESVKKYWQLPPAEGAKVVNDDVLFLRGWSWPTEADASAVLEVSKYLVDTKAIEQPLTWSQVKGAFERTAPLAKQAYEHLGAKPAAAEFVRKDTSDLRGLPVWQSERWSARG
jgi:transposase